MRPQDRTRYLDWIREHVKGPGHGYGKCVEVTGAMLEAFTGELRRRRGFFHDALWGRRTHFWMLTAEGEVVDPTGCQHPSGALLPASAELYEDLTDLTEEEMADRVPSGRCAECGADCYRERMFCSDPCARAFELALGGPS